MRTLLFASAGLACLMLTVCQTADMHATEDSNTCQSYGYTPGSEGFCQLPAHPRAGA